MLYDKPPPPLSQLERHSYGPLLLAVTEAQGYKQTKDPVRTVEVYYALLIRDGGGWASIHVPPDVRTPGYQDKKRIAKLVRRLKKAANADVIDGHRVGSGWTWTPAPFRYTINTTFNTTQMYNRAVFGKPSSAAIITGIV